MKISDILELLKKFDNIEFKKENNKIVVVGIRRKKLIEIPIK